MRKHVFPTRLALRIFSIILLIYLVWSSVKIFNWCNTTEARKEATTSERLVAAPALRGRDYTRIFVGAPSSPSTWTGIEEDTPPEYRIEATAKIVAAIVLTIFVVFDFKKQNKKSLRLLGIGIAATLVCIIIRTTILLLQ